MAGATEAAKQLMLVPSNRLYHYTSADTATKIIVGGEMWATDMRYLNDSEEYQLGKRLVVEPLTTALAGVEGWRDAVHLVEDWLDIQQNGTYVASFTEDGDLLSQWLAYCPTGGYAIEFDARRLAEAAESAVRASLEQCVYEPGEQSALAQSFADAAVAELHDQPIPPDTPVGGQHLIRLRRTLAAGITVLLPRIKSVESGLNGSGDSSSAITTAATVREQRVTRPSSSGRVPRW